MEVGGAEGAGQEEEPAAAAAAGADEAEDSESDDDDVQITIGDIATAPGAGYNRTPGSYSRMSLGTGGESQGCKRSECKGVHRPVSSFFPQPVQV